jgi:hypothetical protein
MTQSRRIKVKGVRKRELSTEDLAYIYYLLGKSVVRERREREARARAKRRRESKRER